MFTALIVIAGVGAFALFAVFALIMSIGTFVYSGTVRFELTLARPFQINVYAAADESAQLSDNPLVLTGSFAMEGGSVLLRFLDSGPKRATLTVYTRAPENAGWPWAAHTLTVRFSDRVVESTDPLFAGIAITAATVQRSEAKHNGQWVYAGHVAGQRGS